MSTFTSATSISTPSATDIAPSTNDSASLRIVAIVVPVTLIVGFVLWILLVAVGVMSSTTRLYHTSTISPSRRHRDEEYLEEPKLWEVQTTTSEVKQQLEDLNPLSMDLFSDLDHGGKNATTSWKTKLGFRAFKKWR
ncbi:hypothetical protein EIP86_006787 [Pleurotus ostreatoroseus]|nr:hypothetical protein EIP86_006787 [Pleurotus ostreatoroseus]